MSKRSFINKQYIQQLNHFIIPLIRQDVLLTEDKLIQFWTFAKDFPLAQLILEKCVLLWRRIEYAKDKPLANVFISQLVQYVDAHKMTDNPHYQYIQAEYQNLLNEQ